MGNLIMCINISQNSWLKRYVYNLPMVIPPTKFMMLTSSQKLRKKFSHGINVLCVMFPVPIKKIMEVEKEVWATYFKTPVMSRIFSSLGKLSHGINAGY